MAEVQTPVALFLFNRPEPTQRVFESLRAVRPARLFLVADGPRPGHAADAARCAAARRVVEAVDWPCTVQRNFAATNLGCGVRVATGLDWVFAQVEEAIILEDDTLPDPSFFFFCQALLARYRHETTVMGIGGHNGLGAWRQAEGSYFFHRHPLTWGWATWRRAWQAFDFSLARYAGCEVDRLLFQHDPGLGEAQERLKWFQTCLQAKTDVWDIQWSLICELVRGAWITPAVNLVENIGFGAEATHTTMDDDLRRYLRRRTMAFPLSAPGSVPTVVDEQFDRWLYLLQKLNSYRHPRLLGVWQRALARTPELAMPGLPAGSAHLLAPLAVPDELQAVLDHLAPELAASPRAAALAAALQAMEVT